MQDAKMKLEKEKEKEKESHKMDKVTERKRKWLDIITMN